MHDARAGIECEVRGIGRGGIGQYSGERGFPIGKNPAASMLIDRGNLKRGEEQARECWPPGWSPPCRRPPPACPTVSTRIDCRPHRPQRSPAPPRPGAPRVGLGDLSQASPRCPALLLASASSPPSHHRPRRLRPPSLPLSPRAGRAALLSMDADSTPAPVPHGLDGLDMLAADLDSAPRFLALYDWQPTQPNCIPLKQGALVAVFSTHPCGWWDGESDGQRGWFPSNYVDIPPSYADLAPSSHAGPPPTREWGDETEAGEDYDASHFGGQEDLSRMPPAMVEASARLDAAVRERCVAQYVACATDVFTAARDTLEALGCQHDTDPLVRSNEAVATHRMHVMRSVRGLVDLSERLGSDLLSGSGESDPHAYDGDALLARSQAVTAAVLALVDVTPLAIAPRRQPVVRSLGDLRSHAAGLDRRGQGLRRATSSTRIAPAPSRPSLQQQPHCSQTDPDKSSRHPSLSPSCNSGAGPAGPIASPALDLSLFPDRVEYARSHLDAALVSFRAAVQIYSGIGLHQMATPEPRSSEAVNNVRDATAHAHEESDRLTSIVDRMLASAPLCAVPHDALALLTPARDEFGLALSHFVAVVESLTHSVAPTDDADSSDAEDWEHVPSRTEAEKVAIAAVPALAAGSALARAGEETASAVLILSAQAAHRGPTSPTSPMARHRAGSAQAERLGLGPSPGGFEAITRPQNPSATSLDSVPMAATSSDGLSYRHDKMLPPPPGRPRSRLSNFKRKVQGLRSSSMASLAGSSRGRSAQRTSTVPNTPSAGYTTTNEFMTASLDMLDPVPMPSSPVARGRLSHPHTSLPPSPGSSSASSVFPLRNGSSDAFVASANRALGLTVAAEGLNLTESLGAYSFPPPTSVKPSEPEQLGLTSEGRLVWNARGALIGGTLDGLITLVAPSEGEAEAFIQHVFALFLRRFTSPKLVAEKLYERHTSAPAGDKGKVLQDNVMAFVWLWLSDAYCCPTDDVEAFPILNELAIAGQAPDLLKLVCRRKEELVTPRMHIIAPLEGHVLVQRVLSSDNAVVDVDQLYTKGWIPSGGNNLKASRSWKAPTKVLDVGPADTAQQLTVLASRLYSTVKPDDFARLNQKLPICQSLPSPTTLGEKLEDSSRLAEWGVGLPALSKLSNRIMGWVIQSILMPDSARERLNALQHFIRVAEVRNAHHFSTLCTDFSLQACLRMNNMHVFFAIQCGLESPPVQRVKSLWRSLPEKYVKKNNEHVPLINPAGNHSAYRERLARAVSAKVPFIPDVGVAKKDLTFVLEGNPPLRDASGRPLRSVSDEKIRKPSEGGHMINWARYARMAEIIDTHTAPTVSVYAIPAIGALQSWLKKCLRQAPEKSNPADDDRLYNRSLELEPRKKTARSVQEPLYPTSPVTLGLSTGLPSALSTFAPPG